jgi:tetratricopeptide (TPR) repeat protein/TolB-like protein/predicted Ser/Thr protein kinase
MDGETTVRVVLPFTLPAEPLPVRPVRHLLAGQLIAGRYRILSLVGRGGMGVVYRAQDEQLNVCVALKVIRPEIAAKRRTAERFRQELRLARQVTHRNAVRIHDIGQDGDLLFLTMDFVDGRSLRTLLDEEGPLSVEGAVDVARQLAMALDAAHQEGIIHRDLKPANVLVTDIGRAYITDFGVARSLHDPGLTRTGAVVGTLAYLSPEQASSGQVDGRSDLYALGLLLFEMLSGERPFPATTASEMLAQRLTGASRDLTDLGIDVPPGLARIVRRLLARDPRRRYQTARELIADLEQGRPVQRKNLLLQGAAACVFSIFLASTGTIVPHLPGTAPLATAALNPLAAVAAPAPHHSVAVLPLADETGRPDLAWVSSGLAEMLAASLSESPGLQVVDSGRVFRTLDDLRLPRAGLSTEDLRRLADLLDADRLVTGHVRSAGGRLRIDLDLTSGDLPGLPAASLHAEAGGAGQIFAATETLGRGLREQLAVEPRVASVTTSSPAALRDYSQGVELLLRGNALAAAPVLERAAAADPRFAAAWIRLAQAREGLGRRTEAREAARRAAESVDRTAGDRPTRAAYEARALDARLQGDPERAQKILSSLLEHYPNDVEARLELGEAYGEQGDLEKAVATFQQAVRLDPDHPRGWFLLAKNAILAGDSRRAIDEYLVRALVVQNRLGSEQGQADVHNAFGIAYRETGDLGRAEESYHKAAEIRRRIGDERGYAATLRNLAALHMVRGRHAEAEDELATALPIVEKLGDESGLADLYSDFGHLEEEQDRYPEALAHYRQALKLRSALGESLSLAESLNDVGYVSYLLGRFDDAMVYWNQGLGLSRTAGDRAGVIVGTQNLGLLQMAQGDWDGALKSFVDALRDSRAIGMKEATASSLGHIGQIALIQGRYQAAVDSTADALKVLTELGDRRGLAEFTLTQAEAALDMGKLDVARERLNAAESLLAGGRNPEQRSMLLRLRGEQLFRQGDRAAAERLFRRSVVEAAASHCATALLQARLAAAHDPVALRSIHKEAATLGHRLLELRSGEALANVLLLRGGKGDLDEAEPLLRDALRDARASGLYAGAHRLHGLLATVLERRGRTVEAAAERTQAR